MHQSLVADSKFEGTRAVNLAVRTKTFACHLLDGGELTSLACRTAIRDDGSCDRMRAALFNSLQRGEHSIITDTLDSASRPHGRVNDLWLTTLSQCACLVEHHAIDLATLLESFTPAFGKDAVLGCQSASDE